MKPSMSSGSAGYLHQHGSGAPLAALTIAACIMGSAGCSPLLATAPPPDHLARSHFYCTDNHGATALDGLLATIGAASAMTLDGPKAVQSGGAMALVFAGTAYYGFKTVSRCKQAKAMLEQRRALLPPELYARLQEPRSPTMPVRLIDRPITMPKHLVSLAVRQQWQRSASESLPGDSRQESTEIEPNIGLRYGITDRLELIDGMELGYALLDQADNTGRGTGERRAPLSLALSGGFKQLGVTQIRASPQPGRAARADEFVYQPFVQAYATRRAGNLRLSMALAALYDSRTRNLGLVSRGGVEWQIVERWAIATTASWGQGSAAGPEVSQISTIAATIDLSHYAWNGTLSWRMPYIDGDIDISAGIAHADYQLSSLAEPPPPDGFVPQTHHILRSQFVSTGVRLFW